MPRYKCDFTGCDYSYRYHHLIVIHFARFHSQEQQRDDPHLLEVPSPTVQEPHQEQPHVSAGLPSLTVLELQQEQQRDYPHLLEVPSPTVQEPHQEQPHVSARLPSPTVQELHPEQQQYLEIFVKEVCKSRNLIDKLNSYNGLLKMLTHPGIADAIQCVAMLYAPSANHDEYRQRRYSLTQSCINYLKENTYKPAHVEICLAINWMLMHEAVVSGAADNPWGPYSMILLVYQRLDVKINYESSLFIIYQLLLAESISPLLPVAHHGINISFVRDCTDPDAVLDLGLSREILYYFGRVIELAHAAPEEAAISDLESQLEAVVPISIVTNADLGSRRKQTDDQELTRVELWKVIFLTAQSYLLSVRLLVKCRLRGYTKDHPDVQILVSALVSILERISLKQSLASAQHGLLPLIVASLFGNEDQRHRIRGRLNLHCKGLKTQNGPNTLGLLERNEKWHSRNSKPGIAIQSQWVEAFFREINAGMTSVG